MKATGRDGRLIFPALVLLLVGLLTASAGAQEGQVREMSIAGSSMAPTLLPGARVRLEAGYYEHHPLERGHLVALSFKTRERPMVKRVIALPGDRVEVRAGRLWLNGRALAELYLTAPRVLPATAGRLLGLQLSRSGGRVPAGHLIVLGDNRANSFDSGDTGIISLAQVLGRVSRQPQPAKTGVKPPLLHHPKGHDLIFAP